MTLELPLRSATDDVNELNRRAEERAMNKYEALVDTLLRPLVAYERALIGWEPRCLAWSV